MQEEFLNGWLLLSWSINWGISPAMCGWHVEYVEYALCNDYRAQTGSEWNSEIEKKRKSTSEPRLNHEGAGQTPRLLIWQTKSFRQRRNTGWFVFYRRLIHWWLRKYILMITWSLWHQTGTFRTIDTCTTPWIIRGPWIIPHTLISRVFMRHTSTIEK